MQQEQVAIILAVQEDWFRTYLRNGLKRVGYCIYPVSNGYEAINLLSLLNWTSDPARLLILDTTVWNEMAETFCHWRNSTEIELPALVVDLPDNYRELKTKWVPDDCLYSIDLRELSVRTNALIHLAVIPEP